MTLTISDSSIKPYFLRAFYEWCCDHDLTPHIVIFINNQVKLPAQYYCLGETITLNIDSTACVNLTIDKAGLSLTTRFSGISHAILAPIENIVSIFALETGQSITFLPDNEQNKLSTTQKPCLKPIGKNSVTNQTAITNKRSNADKKKISDLKKSKQPVLHIVK